MLSVDEGILNLGVMEILAARIRGIEMFGGLNGYPTLEVIKCGAALAHHGLLGPVDFLRLGDIRSIDVSTVPTEHLVSLISSATKAVTIHNVTGNLVTLIDSLKCEGFWISFQSLGREETQALVRAMESRVEVVNLRNVDNVFLYFGKIL